MPANNAVLELKCGSSTAGGNGEHNGVGLVDRPEIFATQDEPFN